MNIFQNLTCGFTEEDFLRICLCSYSERSTHSLELCLMTHQNFEINFLERPFKEHFCEIISKSACSFGEEDFLRISPCLYSAKIPHSPEPCLLTD